MNSEKKCYSIVENDVAKLRLAIDRLASRLAQKRREDASDTASPERRKTQQRDFDVAVALEIERLREVLRALKEIEPTAEEETPLETVSS